MHEIAADGSFWIAVLQIIAIDILLGGDNAVVIALACRRLPEHQRNKGIFWGVFGAIALRLILIFFALQLLALPYLKIVGAVLLLYIGVKLLQPEEGDAEDGIQASTSLMGAIRTIIIADAVMSLDNVVAVAAAARGDLMLVAFGIAVSIPIIVFGSKIVLKLMDRFPIVIVFGGALLGWIAGGMAITDIAVLPLLEGTSGWLHDPSWRHYVSAAAGALFVFLVGTWMARRKLAARAPLEEVGVGTQTDDQPPPK